MKEEQTTQTPSYREEALKTYNKLLAVVRDGIVAIHNDDPYLNIVDKSDVITELHVACERGVTVCVELPNAPEAFAVLKHVKPRSIYVHIRLDLDEPVSMGNYISAMEEVHDATRSITDESPFIVPVYPSATRIEHTACMWIPGGTSAQEVIDIIVDKGLDIYDY